MGKTYADHRGNCLHPYSVVFLFFAATTPLPIADSIHGVSGFFYHLFWLDWDPAILLYCALVYYTISIRKGTEQERAIVTLFIYKAVDRLRNHLCNLCDRFTLYVPGFSSLRPKGQR